MERNKRQRRITSSDIKKLPISKRVQNIVYGGTDCIDVITQINNASAEENRIDQKRIEKLCNDIVTINNREKLKNAK